MSKKFKLKIFGTCFSFLVIFSLISYIDYLPFLEVENDSFEGDNLSQHYNNELRTNNFEELFINYSKISQRRIFFPLTHEQVFTPWDTGTFGYSDFSILLQRYFIEVSTFTEKFSKNIENMTSNDIVFLNVAKYGKYTSNDIGNLTSFVERGGKLIMVGEHAIFNFSQFQNEVLTNFNMSFTEIDVWDEINNVNGDVAWNVFNSSYFELTNLSIMYGSVLNITGNNAFSMANSSHTANHPNAPLMGGFTHPNGKGGRVFACTDSEWIWNTNETIPGIHYGNNSKLVLKLLDWFYETNLSIEVEKNLNVIPEFSLFSGPKFTNFTLNLTLSKLLNVSTEIVGGEIFPKYGTNKIGATSWDINISDSGYIKFTFKMDTISKNFTKIVYFLENNYTNKILFLQDNYSRKVDSSPFGLLKFAHDLTDHNFSVFASNGILNYSLYDCVIIANPLQNYSSELKYQINQSNLNGTKLIFLNVPHAPLDVEDSMFFFIKSQGFHSRTPPINDISTSYGVVFDRHIIGDSVNNIDNKLYYPKIQGINDTYYNISCYLTAVINVSNDFDVELKGYSTSWGEYRPIFGTSGIMGDHLYDGNNTCVMAHTNTTLASGMLHYFTNEFFNYSSSYFNEYLYNWMRTGQFNKKYNLEVNHTDTNFYFKDTIFKVFSNEKIRDFDGQLVPNGTTFNVEMTLGNITSVDSEPLIPGFQVNVFNGSVNLTCSTKEDNGLCEIAIYNSSNYKVILGIFLNFTHPPLLHEIESNPSPNGNLTLQWSNMNQVETYYIFRSFYPIDKDNISSLAPIANVSTTLYRDNLTLFGKYYYAIVGSNYAKNTTVSNCVSIAIHPVLNPITPDPNHDGLIHLTWDPLIGAEKYKILRLNSEITELNYQNPSILNLGTVTGLSYTDTLNFEQGKIYYYVIIGMNLTINSTISNCVNISINYLPNAPIFSTILITSEKKNVLINWSNVIYAIKYEIHLSTIMGFIPSSQSLFITTAANSLNLINLSSGDYYIRIKSIGAYGNSTFSEEIKIEVRIWESITPDNPWPLLIMLFSVLTISSISIFSYFWIYFKRQEKSKNLKLENVKRRE